MQFSTRTIKTNNTKKRLSFKEAKKISAESKRGKQWIRTNKRDQALEEV